MAQKRYEISDEQWNQIKDKFPIAKTGRPPIDNRIIFNAILWIARSGAAWRDLPERFGVNVNIKMLKSSNMKMHKYLIVNIELLCSSFLLN